MLQPTQNITRLSEKEEYTLGLFIDLFKTFHNIDAEIFIKLLRYYGIDDTTLKCFKSYFSNRKQY